MLRQLSTSLRPKGRMVNSLTEEGGLNFRAVDLTEVVKHITSQHKCSPLACVALGRAIVGNVLIAAGKEPNSVCRISINGNGPIGNINSEAGFTSDNEGWVRGFVDNPSAVLPLQSGWLDISGGVGIGFLNVSRTFASRPNSPQQGSIMLETSEIGNDIVAYLNSSEQINSAMSLRANIDTDGGIKSATGFLCTVLPGCTDQELSIAEKNIASVNDKNSETTPIDDVMSNLTVNLGEQYRHESEISSKCFCSKEKFLQSFKLLGQKELQDIISKNEGKETVRCHWCNSEMSFLPSQLSSLIEN